MAKHQTDEQFLSTRAGIAALGVAVLGPEHREMVSRLCRLDDRNRELGPAQHRLLAMDVSAGSATVRCAQLAAEFAPSVDWIKIFTGARITIIEDAPEAQKDTEHGEKADTDPGHGTEG